METKHNMIATFTRQNPFDGKPEPVFLIVDERTTLAELIQWQRKNCFRPDSWTRSQFNIQIISESK